MKTLLPLLLLFSTYVIKAQGGNGGFNFKSNTTKSTKQYEEAINNITQSPGQTSIQINNQEELDIIILNKEIEKITGQIGNNSARLNSIKKMQDINEEIKNEASKLIKDNDSLKSVRKYKLDRIYTLTYKIAEKDKKPELAKEYIDSKNFMFPDKYKSIAFLNKIYSKDSEGFSFLTNTGVNIGNQSGSIYSELVSDNVGPFRVSLGSMISSSSKEDENEQKEEEAYQRLINYGGNTVLTFEYPLWYSHNSNSTFNFLGRLLMKGTADIPAFGTTTEDFAGSGVAALNIYIDISGTKNKIRFFTNINNSWVMGTSSFRENLGIEKKNFMMSQFIIGFVALENLKISFNLSTLSSEKKLENRNVNVGGQVINSIK